MYNREENCNPRVLVVMSTYNGEKFLEEQIKSIMNQEGVEVFCLIRDDGSTDATINLLETFSKENMNIRYYCGSNVGVVNSYNDLLLQKEVDEYSWIAFCDQDDVWNEKKLYNAIQHIKDVNKGPVLYCSNLQLVDEQLNPIGEMRLRTPRIDRYTAMVENCATGCTCVFNHEAVALYREGISSRIEMHDYWMYLVCVFMGHVYYDSSFFIKYRQHNNNVVGAEKRSAVKALKNIYLNHDDLRRNMVLDFYNIYSNKLTYEDKKILEPVINYRKGIKNKLRLLLDKKYYGHSIAVSVGFKIRVLLGRLY